MKLFSVRFNIQKTYPVDKSYLKLDILDWSNSFREFLISSGKNIVSDSFYAIAEGSKIRFSMTALQQWSFLKTCYSIPLHIRGMKMSLSMHNITERQLVDHVHRIMCQTKAKIKALQIDSQPKGWELLKYKIIGKLPGRSVETEGLHRICYSYQSNIVTVDSILFHYETAPYDFQVIDQILFDQINIYLNDHDKFTSEELSLYKQEMLG